MLRAMIDQHYNHPSGAIEPMSFVVQFLYEPANLVLVKLREIAWPVILISESPEDHRWVIVVLVNHGAQHLSRQLLISVIPQPSSRPRDLFQNEQAQFVALIQHC